jgi:hypothetical protein
MCEGVYYTCVTCVKVCIMHEYILYFFDLILLLIIASVAHLQLPILVTCMKVYVIHVCTYSTAAQIVVTHLTIKHRGSVCGHCIIYLRNGFEGCCCCTDSCYTFDNEASWKCVCGRCIIYLRNGFKGRCTDGCVRMLQLWYDMRQACVASEIAPVCGCVTMQFSYRDIVL